MGEGRRRNRSCLRSVGCFGNSRPLEAGTMSAPSPGRRFIMSRFLNTVLLGAVLLAPITLAPTALRAQDRKAVVYHDKGHNDDHEWNSHENQAYHAWVKEGHRRNTDFARLNEN